MSDPPHFVWICRVETHDGRERRENKCSPPGWNSEKRDEDRVTLSPCKGASPVTRRARPGPRLLKLTLVLRAFAGYSCKTQESIVTNAPS